MEDNTVNADVSENSATIENESEKESSVSVCAKCGATLESDSDFCPKCGTPKKNPKSFCAKCGADLKEDQIFCPKCGHKVGDAINISTNDKKTSGNKNYLKILIPVAVVVIAIVSTILIIKDSKIDSISFETKSMELFIDDSVTNPYTILPAKKQDKKVTWNSSDPSVATVNADGTVTAVGEGDCVITVSRGDKHDEFNVHVYSKFEGNLIKGNYSEAYKNAKTDEEKELVIAENLAAVESAFITENLKDPTSFVLGDVYYDSNNSRIVLIVSANNSYGGRVSSYFLFKQYGNDWEYYTSVSDLEEEEYYKWDDYDDFIEKAARNLGREYISESLKEGTKLDKSSIQRINTMFEEGKLENVKLIDVDS